MGPMPRPTSNLPLGVLMDCASHREEKMVKKQISTVSRTSSTLVLIGIGFLVFLIYWFSQLK
jgi:hypothetical protein